MTDFMAKMHQIRFRLQGSVQRPQTPYLDLGPTSKGSEREGRRGKGGEGSVPIVPVLRNDHCIQLPIRTRLLRENILEVHSMDNAAYITAYGDFSIVPMALCFNGEKILPLRSFSDDNPQFAAQRHVSATFVIAWLSVSSVVVCQNG